eukprot:81869_1
MSSLALVFLSIFDLASSLDSLSSCKFDGDLNLEALAGINIQCIWPNDPTLILQYMPCRSILECNPFDGNIWMVLQNSIGGSCAAGIARFDDTQPTRTIVDGQTAFTFQYKNGQSSFNCYTPRSFELTFICDPKADPYNSLVMDCGETPACSYYLRLRTKYACVASNEEAQGLSAGSVLLILFFVLLFVYCVGGFIYKGMRNPEQDWCDFQNNVPNLSFWKYVVSLTCAGCDVSKDYVKSKVTKVGTINKNKHGYDELAEDPTAR